MSDADRQTVRVRGASVRRFELTEAWAGRDRGRDGWDLEPAQTAAAARLAAEVAQTALDELGPDALAREDTEIVAATFNGTAHLGELIHEQLRDGGPKWVAPESFLYYSPQCVNSVVALELGLGGATTTLVGPRAGVQALAQAVRRVRTGRARSVLVLGYEMLSRFATSKAREHRHLCPEAQGSVVAAVLTANAPAGSPVLDGPAVPEIAVRLGTTEPWQAADKYAHVWSADLLGLPDLPGQRTEPASSPAMAALHAVAAAMPLAATGPTLVVSGGPKRYDLVVMNP